jgi:drug/metabolite transporter (DMT)-like permease
MITGVLGLVAGFIFESATKQGMIMAVPALLYAGLLSSGVGFTLQIVAQKHTPAAEAALITSLQSVFAAVAGAVLLQEHLTLVTTTGCVLILFGVVIVEIGPLLLQGIRPPRP